MKFIHKFNTYTQFCNKVSEGLIKTYPIDYTIKMIDRHFINYKMKYSIEKIDYENSTFEFKINDFNYIDLLNDKINGIESVIVNICGYFPSLIKIDYVNGMSKKRKWNDEIWKELVQHSNYYLTVTITFESKFDKIDIDNNDFMYHLTNKSYVDKILKYGLVPKSKSKLSTHPDRIYLCKNISDCDKLKTSMLNSDMFNSLDYTKENNKSLEYVILKIDFRNLKTKIYNDQNYGNGYYILNNIEPKRISIVK